MHKLIMACLLCVCVAPCFAQDDGGIIPPPTPIEGPLENIADRIEGRINARLDLLAERLSERLERLDIETPVNRLETETRAGFGRISELIGQIRSDVAEAREERQTLLARIREINVERDGIIARIAEARDELRQAREEWRPLQNLVDRIIGLVWKLIYLVVLLCVLAGLALLAWSYMWARVRSAILAPVTNKP